MHHGHATSWRLDTHLKTGITREEPSGARHFSPNRGYYYTQDGFRPTVTLTVYAEKDHFWTLAFHDAFGVSDVKWINEKWLFVRVWWGRIAIDDLIVDVEKEKIVSSESADDAYTAHQQYRASCAMLLGCKCMQPSAPP